MKHIQWKQIVWKNMKEKNPCISRYEPVSLADRAQEEMSHGVAHSIILFLYLPLKYLPKKGKCKADCSGKRASAWYCLGKSACVWVDERQLRWKRSETCRKGHFSTGWTSLVYGTEKRLEHGLWVRMPAKGGLGLRAGKLFDSFHDQESRILYILLNKTTTPPPLTLQKKKKTQGKKTHEDPQLLTGLTHKISLHGVASFQAEMGYCCQTPQIRPQLWRHMWTWKRLEP